MAAILTYIKAIISFVKRMIIVFDIAISEDLSNMLDNIEDFEVPALY